MRLLRYLNENESDLEKFVNQWKLVKKNCKPFLNAIKTKENFLLYRGMRNKPEIGIHSVRQDRHPKDTALGIHQALDDTLEDEFGWKPRSQGLFTSTSFDMVYHYGEPYVVFPIGKFKYIYDPKVSDSYKYLSNDRIMEMFLKIHNVSNNKDLYMKLYGPEGEINNKGTWFSYDGNGADGWIPVTSTEKDVKKAYTDILSKKKFNAPFDIYWHSESFPSSSKSQPYRDSVWNITDKILDGLRDNDPQYEEFKQYMVQEVLGKGLNYKETNLTNAGTNSEVIVKCDSYYYLSYDLYRDQIRKNIWGEK